MLHRCYFIPKRLEDRVHERNKDIGPKASNVSEELRSNRRALTQDPIPPSNLSKNHVYTAKNRRRQPGTLVASSINEATISKDLDVVGAWVLSNYFHRFCQEVLNRPSHNLNSTVHYYTKYCNAFFDGVQMVYGDGDGVVFEDFAQDPSAVFHELWHGVTDKTCGLTYQDQPGALNESLSDIFASIIMQWVNGENVDQASWLIGERCVISSALRSLADPGTAFVNHEYLGSDDQPQDMNNYDPNGDVHKNSGIPNHAFYLFAKSVGGYSWDIPCKIWFRTITTPGLISPNASFAEFAQATLTIATDSYPSVVEKLRKAWQTVKVL